VGLENCDGTNGRGEARVKGVSSVCGESEEDGVGWGREREGLERWVGAGARERAEKFWEW